jgi:hypothetical protein
MKTRETTPGKTYSVHTSSGCTVSDKNGWSKTIDAPDGYFTAHAGEVTIDGDDAADIRELFKLAPQQRLAILGVLGGNSGGLPAGYKRVEYLESTGTQYIGGYGYSESVEKARGEWVSQFTKLWTNALFGFDAGQRCMGVGTSNKWSNYTGNADREKHVFRIESDSVEGTVSRQIDNLGWQKKTGLTLSKNVTISPFSVSQHYMCALRCFSAKIWDGDTPHRMFVPCLDETGAPCMYDVVKKQPFYNSSTDDFLYPTESTTYSLRRVIPDWGKLTERGLRRLYHAPAGYAGELYDYALENGYKPIVEPEKPETGYWAPRWTETEDEIILEWVETEPPMDEFGMPDESLTETE